METMKGFRCTIGLVMDFPPDDKALSFPVYVFFDSYAEFENVVQVSPTFTFDDILNYSPPAIDVSITTAYTGGDVIVRALYRGSGLPATGLDQVTDWETMGSTLATLLPVSVTVVSEGGQGAYTLTIKKDTGGTPVNLAATDTVTLQAHDDDATLLTSLSHVFDVIGGA